MYQIVLSQQVREEDLSSIPKNIVSDILQKIELHLPFEPEKVGKVLIGGLKGCRELKVSAYRVIYHVERKQVIVMIITIGLRRDEEVFRIAKKRLS